MKHHNCTFDFIWRFLVSEVKNKRTMLHPQVFFLTREKQANHLQGDLPSPGIKLKQEIIAWIQIVTAFQWWNQRWRLGHTALSSDGVYKRNHTACEHRHVKALLPFVIVNTAPVRQSCSLTGIQNEGVTLNEWQWFNRQLSLHSHPFELGGVWIVLYYIWRNPGTRFIWKNYSPLAELPEEFVILTYF